ncbi:CpaB family protein [Jatrophihabitans fulvus]
MSLRLHLAGIGRVPRLLAAAACLLLAAVSALDGAGSGAAAPAHGVPVVVAARPLAAGHHLTSRDLTVARWARAQAPPGAAARAGPLLGRVVAGPIAVREAVLPLRLVDTALTAGLPAGSVALPLELTGDVRGLVAPGGRIDLIAVPLDPSGGSVGGPPAHGREAGATRAASGVRVLAVLPPAGSGGVADPAGCRVIVAVTPEVAARLAGMGGSWRFTAVAQQP